MEQLRDIYLLASATLVEDAGLICTKVTTTLDLSLAIWLSDWTSCVWTLQEGILSSKLLFCVGNDVLALSQIQCLVAMVDTRYMIPSSSMNGYGLGELGLGLPLITILNLAAGRQTSWPQDQMYGLSALLPSTKLTRAPSLEMVAVDVAKMYMNTRVVHGILQVDLERCQTENFRWMPLSAKYLYRQLETGVHGLTTAVGLWCPATALIRITSAMDKSISGLPLDIPDTESLDFNTDHLYQTGLPAVYIGTRVKAKNLIFCRVGSGIDDRSYGFVVALTSRRGVFFYDGEAIMFDVTPVNDDSIFVT
jgi:hypothetical protein